MVVVKTILVLLVLHIIKIFSSLIIWNKDFMLVVAEMFWYFVETDSQDRKEELKALRYIK